MEKVLEANKNRIVLTNNDILMFVNKSRARAAFDRVQRASSVSGKTQYWVYRLWKRIEELHRDLDSVRTKIVVELCDKDPSGEVLFLDAEYVFDAKQKKLYEDEIKPLQSLMIEKEEKLKEIAEKYCKRDDEGSPLKRGGNVPSFSKENLEKFDALFSEVLKEESTLPFDKIVIKAELLEKMNDRLSGQKGAEIISIDDMIVLEKVFSFVEE